MSANGKDYGYFFNSEKDQQQNDDRTYDADSFSEWLHKFFTTGVFEDDLEVLANNNMTVTVQTGYANVEGKVRLFDATTTLIIETADATYNRIDTVVVERNDTNREITLKVVKGGYSSEPTPTAPVRENGVYQLVLAEIYVEAGATSITQSIITDKRTDTTVCGFVYTPVDTFDFDQFAVQFEAYLAEFKATRAAGFETWELAQQAAFEAWFDEIKGQLSEDAAGHLQNEIDELKEDGLSGSIITVTTSENSLIGKTVTLTDSQGNTKTGVFDSNKKALFQPQTQSTQRRQLSQSHILEIMSLKSISGQQQSTSQLHQVSSMVRLSLLRILTARLLAQLHSQMLEQQPIMLRQQTHIHSV